MLDIYILFEYNIHMVNMKCRFIFFSLSFFSVLLGLLIYIFFRSETYIHLFLEKFFAFDALFFSLADNSIIDFLRYYFVDFLWCFSLLCILSGFSQKFCVFNLVTVSAVSVSLGIFFEFLQKVGYISGTFDYLDILMYVIAGLCHAFINIIFYEALSRKEKL